MKEIPLNIRQKISKYEPIKMESLVIYPVRVFEHDDFVIAKESIEFLPQALPVRYISKPLLSAYYALDMEKIINGEKITGLFVKALSMLALSLRLWEGEEMKERIKKFGVIIDEENPLLLKRIVFLDNEGKQKELNPSFFQKIRNRFNS